ncbi:MAG: hypothetical protein HY939_06410 [Gammaproteobacteria bacterium]|nr:hypothetical protein [Gammaproteobacteria bacterium]
MGATEQRSITCLGRKQNIRHGLVMSMCLFYTSSVCCASTPPPVSIPLNGSPSIEVPFANEKPGPVSMGLDAVLGRPLLLVTTLLGVGLFTLSLPFSLVKHEVGSAAKGFIWVPAQATFTRCLGCSLNMAAYDRRTYPVVT